jgi:hypothetical protein
MGTSFLHLPLATGCPITQLGWLGLQSDRRRVRNIAIALGKNLCSHDDVMQSGVEMFTPILASMSIMAVDNYQ